MSQFLSMLPSQQMRMEQRLTPQLIQSMEILQLPLLALEARVREELESNPVLEELDPAQTNEPDEPTESTVSTPEEAAEADGFARLETMSHNLELDPGDLPYASGRSSTMERDPKMDAMANTASRSEGLKESLLHQWAFVETSDSVKQAGEALIDWMDEDGYLRFDSEDASHNNNGDSTPARPLIFRHSEEEMDRLMEMISLSRTPPIDRDCLEEALGWVQKLEPVGICARDLSECLLVQLKANGEDDPFLALLVQEHLDELAKNLFPAVARKTGRSIEDIKEALKRIGRLNHHPGLLINNDEVPRISPDIIIEYDDEGDNYKVRLVKGSIPRLRISPHYRRMLRDKSQDKKARDFVRTRIEAAGAIIDAIHYRRERMLELAKIIVERQREFFDYGPRFLTVLRMRELAKTLECDPSTISRTVDGKYLQSPQGIYPLRMFFTGGITDDQGKSVSWDSIKAKVKEIIENENKSNPLSDDEIAKKLEESGTSIARRTIAKYRSQLNIPSAGRRREY